MGITSPEEPKYLILNKESDWQKGFCDNIDYGEFGLSLKLVDEYALEKFESLREYNFLSEDLDFAYGNCGIFYLLDRKKCLVCAFDIMNSQLLWTKSVKKYVDKVNSIFSQDSETEGSEEELLKLKKIEYFRGNFYLLIGSRLSGVVVNIAQINHDIRWSMGNSKQFTITTGMTPYDITVDEEGCFYVLMSEYNKNSNSFSSTSVFKFNSGAQVLNKTEINYLTDISNSCIKVMSNELFILDISDRKLYITSSNKTINLHNIPSGICIDSSGIYIGNGKTLEDSSEKDLFLYGVNKSDGSIKKVPGYRGLVDRIILDENKNLYILCSERKGIAVLTLKPKVLRKDENPLPVGTFYSLAFDSITEGTLWHKLVVDCDIPKDSQVVISYYISDNKGISTDAHDIDELVRRKDKDILETINWTTLLTNPKDALINTKRGRFLWLRIQLIANDRFTPVIKSICAHFPFTSYMEYLPAVYSENQKSKEFLERFLALFQTFFLSTEKKIDNISRYFDVDAVSGEYLLWIAEWLSISYDTNWSEDKLKKLIKKAPQLYKKRGTRLGISELVELFSGEKPVIVEQFQFKYIKDKNLVNDLGMLYGEDSFTFHIILRPDQIKDKSQLSVLKRLVEANTPAHTKVNIVLLQEHMYLGVHTYLEINSRLAVPDLRLDTGSFMPMDTVIFDKYEAGQAGKVSRLGVDTTIT